MAETAKFRATPEEEFGLTLGRLASGVRPIDVASRLLPGGVTAPEVGGAGLRAGAAVAGAMPGLSRAITAPARTGLAVAEGFRSQNLPSSVTIPAPPRPAELTTTPDMIDNIEAAGVRSMAGRDASGRLAFEGPRVVSAGGRTVLTNLADPSSQLTPGAADLSFRGPEGAAPSAGIRQPAAPTQPIQAADLLRNISTSDLTPAGIAAAANIQAASERGIRQRVRDEQTAIEEERKLGEAETNALNAEINRQNMLVNRQKGLVDLAKGIRELENPEIDLETVKSTDPKTGIVSEQSFVRTPQGLVPFNEYQIATQVEAADLEGARSAIAQGRDRAGVLAKLQAKYPGIDFKSL